MTHMINCIGDSQTQMTPYYAVPPELMWVEQVAVKMRAAGYNVKARSYGVGGTCTGQMMNRVDVLSMWEIPDIAILYGGVNDTETGSISTASAGTSGSINVTAGAQYYGIGMVITFIDGSIFAPVLSSVQLAVGTTGSITLGASSANSSVASIGVYATPIGYANATLATANNRSLFLQTSLAQQTSGSITALVNTIPMPTCGTQAMSQAFCKAMKYGVTGVNAGAAKLNWVLSQTNLPANSKNGQRAIVLDDTSVAGGLNKVLPSQSTLINTANYSTTPQQTVWECRTPQAGELGWGRVAVTGTSAFSGCCNKLMLVSTNYLNWTSGGDNIGAGTFFALNQAIRLLTQAAATAEGAVYVDLFNFEAGLITSGETTQGSSSWHAIANNQHHNAYGHDIVARCVVTAINTQTAWLSVLSS